MNTKTPLKHIKQAGFTLAELLIVMAIIGLLTAVLVTKLVKSAQQRKTATETVAFITDIAATQYDAADSTKHLYVDTDSLCATSAAGANQLSTFCTATDGTTEATATLQSPQGTATIAASGNYQFTITFTNQSTPVAKAILEAYPAECTGTDSIVCTFGDTYGGGSQDDPDA